MTIERLSTLARGIAAVALSTGCSAAAPPVRVAPSTPAPPPVAAAPVAASALPPLALVEHRVATRAELPDPWFGRSTADFDTYVHRTMALLPGGARDPGTNDDEESARTLARFGFRLQDSAGARPESPDLDLVRGDTVLRKHVALTSRAVVNARGDDLMFSVSTPRGDCWLVRKASLGPCDGWAFDRPRPLFVGNDRLSIEVVVPKDLLRPDGSFRDGLMRDPESNGPPTHLVTLRVKREEAIVLSRAVEFRYRPLVESLTAWGDQWAIVLADEGDVLLDGTESLAHRGGYASVFGWTIFHGAPLYFFRRKEGGIGLDYRGAELAVRYDEVAEGLCCEPATLNPWVEGDGTLYFNARRGDDFYFVAARPPGATGR